VSGTSTEREIFAAPATGMAALTAFNRPVYESHEQLTAILRQRLGERHARIFARPTLANGRIVWTTPAAGPIRAWSSLTPAERVPLEPARAALGKDIAGLAAQLARSGVNTREGNLGPLLQTAMEIPSGAHLFAVGEQPVLAFWGFRSPSGQAFDPFNEIIPIASAPSRSRAWLWLLLLLLLALAAAGAWLFWHHQTVTPPPRPPPSPLKTTPLPPPPPPPKPPPPPPPPRVPEPPPVKAALPANRWAQHDLSMLKGCWKLGHEVPATLTDNNGNLIAHGVTRAGQLCFDSSGHGQRTTENDFPQGKYACAAPVSATFGSDDTLVTQQPVVICAGTHTRWSERTLACRRRDDNIADCVTGGGQAVEFRREQ